ADGDTSSKSFNVPILNNSEAGTNRTVFLTLSNATGSAYISSPSSAVLTITNVAPPPLSSYATWKLAHFGANANHFELQFNRNLSATDLTYSAQAASGLPGVWSNLATYLPGSGWITNTPGSTVTESGDRKS